MYLEIFFRAEISGNGKSTWNQPTPASLSRRNFVGLLVVADKNYARGDHKLSKLARKPRR